MEGVSARSWHTVKAALLHVISQEYMAARRACDALQKTGDWDGAGKQAVIARRAVIAYDKVQASERPELTKKRATKRHTLPRSDDWQALVYETASPVQKEAIAVMWAAGARPDEVERGVEVKWVKKLDTDAEERYLMVTIKGAKITETSGQEERAIVIDPSSAGRLRESVKSYSKLTAVVRAARGEGRLRAQTHRCCGARECRLSSGASHHDGVSQLPPSHSGHRG